MAVAATTRATKAAPPGRGPAAPKEGSQVYVIDERKFDVFTAPVHSAPSDKLIYVQVMKGLVAVGDRRYALTLNEAKKKAVALLDDRVTALNTELKALEKQRHFLAK